MFTPVARSRIQVYYWIRITKGILRVHRGSQIKTWVFQMWEEAVEVKNKTILYSLSVHLTMWTTRRKCYLRVNMIQHAWLRLIHKHEGCREVEEAGVCLLDMWKHGTSTWTQSSTLQSCKQVSLKTQLKTFYPQPRERHDQWDWVWRSGE